MNPIRSLLAAALVALAVPVSAADGTCQRQVESKGDYSLCPPDGWETRPPGKSPYHSFFLSTSDSLDPNINVYDEASDLPLGEFVEAARKTAMKMALDAGFKRIDIVEQSDFVTHSREKAVRVVYSSEFRDNQLATVQYVFDGTRGRKVIVTCTMLESQKERITSICDRSLRTYRTEKKQAQ